MTRSNATAFAAYVLSIFISVLVTTVDGYSMTLTSDPTNVHNGNVRNQWDLPFQFGEVTIPGAAVTTSMRNGYGEEAPFYAPLQPVTAQDESYGYSTSAGYMTNSGAGYSEPFWNSHVRSSTGTFLSLASSGMAPSPLSTGRVWNYNNQQLGIQNIDSFRKASNRRRARSGGRSFARGTPALSMANYMQNGGPGNGGGNRDNYSNNNNNRDRDRDYNQNSGQNRDTYNDYDEHRSRGPYDNENDRDRDRQNGGGPSRNQPRGNNRFNTVGGIGSVNGANVSREGRSMQFQNRRDSNTAGRSGRMMEESSSFSSNFAPDSNSRFESRSPNDNYSRGGYRQDERTGHWTDPNSNYNINDSPRVSNPNTNSRNGVQSSPSVNAPAYSSENRYASPPRTSGFSPSIPGDHLTAPEVRGPVGYQRQPVGAGGNIPYDNANYNTNNYESQGSRDYYNDDSDFYSRNGNIMDNHRGSRGNGDRVIGSPGMDSNYYNVGDYGNSNQRLDRGGGLMRYRPNNQRGDGGYYGSENQYEVGGEYSYGNNYNDDYYDSSGTFYNHEGKRVRRFDPYSDRSEGYYNPEHLSNDSTDPGRAVQNQRRRDGKDVQNGTHLRRYDPEWDGRQGLYNEASLYGSDVKGTRSYANDSMDHRVSGRGGRGRSRSNGSDGPSVVGPGRGESSGRDRHPMSSSRFGDRDREYQDRDDYMEDGYDRGQGQSRNRSGRDRDRDRYEYDEYESEDRSRRGSLRRGLGRRDVDGERDYYRSGDYRSGGGPDVRGDDSMERFRQGKDVKKADLYGFETANTVSSKKPVNQQQQRSRKGGGRGNGRNKQQARSRGDANRDRVDLRDGRNVNGGGGYNAQSSSSRGRRRDGGRVNGAGGRDRGLSLDDLNEML